MDRMIINAVNTNGKHYQFKLQCGTSSVVIFQDGTEIGTEDHLNAARDHVEAIIKWLDAHMEDIIQQDGEASWAIAFDRLDADSVIIRVLEWMGGRYVQLGPDERYSVDCASYEYGYC